MAHLIGLTFFQVILAAYNEKKAAVLEKKAENFRKDVNFEQKRYCFSQECTKRDCGKVLSLLFTFELKMMVTAQNRAFWTFLRRLCR